MATNIVPTPSPAQLALALAVVKLKPANVDIKGQTAANDNPPAYC